MLMAGSTLSACGSLKVNVGGKDIVNIEEKTESIADDINSENKDLQKAGNQNDENETDFDTNEWDNEKKTTFSGSGIDLTLPVDTPDTFVEVNKLEKDYFTLTVFCDYKNTSVGSESSLNLYCFDAKQLGIRNADGAKKTLFKTCIENNSVILKSSEPEYTSIIANDGNKWDIATTNCTLSDGNIWKTILATTYDNDNAFAVMYLDCGTDDFDLDIKWLEKGLKLNGDIDFHGTTGSGSEIDIQKLINEDNTENSEDKEEINTAEKTYNKSAINFENFGISEDDVNSVMTYLDAQTVGDLTVYIPHNSVDYPIDGRSNGSTQQIKKSWELQYDDSSYVDHLTAQTYVTYSPASAFDDESAYFETLSSFKEYVESANISYQNYIFTINGDEYELWMDDSNDGYTQGEVFITHTDGSCSTIETTVYYSGTTNKEKGKSIAQALVCAQLLMSKK